MSNGLTLPPLNITAAAPGYSPPQGVTWPAPNPALVFTAQQHERNAFYGQGMWREMIIKITNEQKPYIKNGVATSIVQSIIRDMQTIPFADNYICLNPNLSPTQALHYATKNFKAGSVPESKGLSAGLLTPAAAFGHFLFGKGATAETNINSLGLNLSNTTIPMLESAFASAPVGRTVIALNKVPFDTFPNSWLTGAWLGNITLKIEGTITKNESGRINFNGGARSYHDVFDGNLGTWRSLIGEASTSVRAAVEKYLNAQPYQVAIKGTHVMTIDR